MTTRSPILPVDLDPAEVAYREGRRRDRRRRWLAIATASSVVLSLAAWKVGKHLAAAFWLESNQYVVAWGADRDNWTLGGSTMVRFTRKRGIFASERPLLGLNHLTDLHRVEELDLATLFSVRDAELANLGRLTDLRRLNLDRRTELAWNGFEPVQLTDATFSQIDRLTRLVELNLGHQRFTDDGLSRLVALDQLRNLDLTGTEVTDVGLESLKTLPSLKELDVSGTRVTARGLAAFESARPGVKVIADHLPMVPLTSPSTPTDPQAPR